MEMAHFKKYRSFKKLERRLFSLGERIFALDSKYVRYKQRDTVYFIRIILIFSHNSSFGYLCRHCRLMDEWNNRWTFD